MRNKIFSYGLDLLSCLFASASLTAAAIGRVRYINILTWFRGFQDKLLYFVCCLICFRVFWELRDQRNLNSVQFGPEILVNMLEYWYIECGLINSRGIYLQSCSICRKLQRNRRQIFPFTRHQNTTFEEVGFRVSGTVTLIWASCWKILNSKKKASMYLLKGKAMIPSLESTDWCVCKFSSKQRRVREARKDLMQELSTACHPGCSRGCHSLFLSGFRFWSITRNEILCYRCWKSVPRNSNGYRSWFS